MVEQDTRGKGRIIDARIYSGLSGVNVNVTKNLMTVQIYEDVYSPFISCDITFIDYESIANRFPLAGEEYFYIKFASHKGREIDFTFLLYKQQNVGGTPMSTLKGMVLHGVTLEYAFDRAKTITHAQTGTYSSIVSDIFNSSISKDASGLQLAYEPSRGIATVVPSFWSPLETIEYCRERAIASSEVKSPFVFFRNVDGYHFRSINGLFNEMAAKPEASVVHTFASRTLPGYFDEREDSGVRVDIVDYHINSYYDTMEKAILGAYNTDCYSFDILTKTFLQNKRFNLVDDGSKFQLGGAGGPHNRQQFMSLFKDTRCNVSYVPTNVAREIDGKGTKDFYPEFVGEKRAYTNLLGEYNFKATLYGDSDLTVGQVMQVSVPRMQDDDQKGARKGTQDLMYTGHFLTTRLEHVLSFDSNVEYYMRVSMVNGARTKTIEGVRDE